MMGVNKTFFDGCFSLMAMFQDQTEKMLTPFVDRMPGMDEAGKKFIRHWSDEYKKIVKRSNAIWMKVMPERKLFSTIMPC